jgi:outer membrane protein assembly factor BamE (lipoprotein component of BamABCDE complex)
MIGRQGLETSIFRVLIYVVMFFVLLGAYGAFKRSLRRSNLMAKYQDESVVDAIMSGSVALGMTASQVQDSLGTPEDIDEKVYKSKTAKFYKYGHIRSNQYKLRIKLENDVVVGWESK